jgi:hypothetical protein
MEPGDGPGGRKRLNEVEGERESGRAEGAPPRARKEARATSPSDFVWPPRASAARCDFATNLDRNAMVLHIRVNGHVAEGLFAAGLVTGVVLTALALRPWRSSTLASEEQENTDKRRNGISQGIEGCIGNTPLIRIKSLSDATGCEILAKAEVSELCSHNSIQLIRPN